MITNILACISENRSNRNIHCFDCRLNYVFTTPPITLRSIVNDLAINLLASKEEQEERPGLNLFRKLVLARLAEKLLEEVKRREHD